MWRFLTTFADVVGLWPFTIDELVQGFHDYVSLPLLAWHISHLSLSQVICAVNFFLAYHAVCAFSCFMFALGQFVVFFWCSFVHLENDITESVSMIAIFGGSF